MDIRWGELGPFLSLPPVCAASCGDLLFIIMTFHKPLVIKTYSAKGAISVYVRIVDSQDWGFFSP